MQKNLAVAALIAEGRSGPNKQEDAIRSTVSTPDNWVFAREKAMIIFDDSFGSRVGPLKERVVGAEDGVDHTPADPRRLPIPVPSAAPLGG